MIEFNNIEPSELSGDVASATVLYCTPTNLSMTEIDNREDFLYGNEEYSF